MKRCGYSLHDENSENQQKGEHDKSHEKINKKISNANESTSATKKNWRKQMIESILFFKTEEVTDNQKDIESKHTSNGMKLSQDGSLSAGDMNDSESSRTTDEIGESKIRESTSSKRGKKKRKKRGRRRSTVVLVKAVK